MKKKQLSIKIPKLSSLFFLGAFGESDSLVSRREAVRVDDSRKQTGSDRWRRRTAGPLEKMGEGAWIIKQLVRIIKHLLFKYLGFIICLGFLISYFGFISSNKAFAQSFSLSINPPVIEVTLKPNTSLIQAFTLQNQGETIKLTPQIVPIKPTDQKGHTTLDLDKSDTLSKSDLSSSVRSGECVEPDCTGTTSYPPLTLNLENSNLELGEPFTLKAGQSTQLVLRLKSSPVDSPQDTYLALTLSPTPSSKNQPGQLSRSLPTLTSLILTTTTSSTDQIPLDLSLKNFSPPRLHDSQKPLKLEPLLINNSPVMFRPQGQLLVKNLRGLTVKKISLPQNLILGSSSRFYPLTYQPSLLDLGPHTLTLQIKTQQGETIIQETRPIFLLPIQAIIYTLVLAIMAITLLTHLKKKQSQLQNPSPSNNIDKKSS